MRVIATLGDGSEVTRSIKLGVVGRSLGHGKGGDVMATTLFGTNPCGEDVAIKMVVIKHRSDAMEVKYLKTLQHNNIVKLLYHFRKRVNLQHKVEFLVMERMSTSLEDLYHGTRPSNFYIKLYMYQLIRSVGYIHAHGVCHRDIKPGNLLINPETCVLKLCDFGSATDLSLKEENATHVGTPQYVAPELLLGFTNYTNSVDLWAIGCVLVKLMKGKRLIHYREATATDQLFRLIEVFGTPTQAQFIGMEPSFPFEELPKAIPLKWSQIVSPFPISGDAALLCSRLLCYSPSHRLSPQQALADNFFDELRSPTYRYLDNGKMHPPLFNFQPDEFPGYQHLIPSHLRMNQASAQRKRSENYI